MRCRSGSGRQCFNLTDTIESLSVRGLRAYLQQTYIYTFCQSASSKYWRLDEYEAYASRLNSIYWRSDGYEALYRHRLPTSSHALSWEKYLISATSLGAVHRRLTYFDCIVQRTHSHALPPRRSVSIILLQRTDDYTGFPSKRGSKIKWQC